MLLLNFKASFAAEAMGAPPKHHICTNMGSLTNIKVVFNSPNPLPPNLAIALNGNIAEVDECSRWDFFKSNIKLNKDRTKAEVTFYKNYTTDNFKLYFPKGHWEPKSKKMNLIIYDRPNCADPPSQFQEISDAMISWEPVYINGVHCGITSYSGESQVDL